MKKIIVLIAITLSALSVKAQEVKWLDSFDEAIKESKNTGKPILANFTGSDWCGWCIRLDKEVFSKAEFKEWADKNVVLLTVDFPRRKELPAETVETNAGLQKAFGVRGYPTLWMFKPGDGQDPKQDMEALGKTGYVKGGPNKWIASIAQYLPKK